MQRKLAAACAALALGAACLSAAGCNDLLTEEPKGFTTTDTFYRTAADVNSATVAAYSAVRGLQGFFTWHIMELASDQARSENRESSTGTRGPDWLDWDAGTGPTGAFWTTMYPAITRAIHVDIRYMLWVMKEVDGADNLLKEMTIKYPRK